jgi:hypothetical protein
MDWIELAQNEIQRRAQVNTVIILSSLKAGIYLASCTVKLFGSLWKPLFTFFTDKSGYSAHIFFSI